MTNFDQLRHDLLQVALSAQETSTGLVRSFASRPNAAGPTLVNQHAALTHEVGTLLLSLLDMGIAGVIPASRIDALQAALTAAGSQWAIKTAASSWMHASSDTRLVLLTRAGWSATDTDECLVQDWDSLHPAIRDALVRAA